MPCLLLCSGRSCYYVRTKSDPWNPCGGGSARSWSRHKFSPALVFDQGPGKPSSQAARQRRSAAAPDRDAGFARGGHRRKPPRLRTTQRAHTVSGLITVFHVMELQTGGALPAPNRRLIRTSSARAICADSTKSGHRTVPFVLHSSLSPDPSPREVRHKRSRGEHRTIRRTELIPHGIRTTAKQRGAMCDLQCVLQTGNSHWVPGVRRKNY